MEAYHFRQPLLAETLMNALAADVVSQILKLLRLLSVEWHASLRRASSQANTAQWGVKKTAQERIWRAGVRGTTRRE